MTLAVNIAATQILLDRRTTSLDSFASIAAGVRLDSARLDAERLQALVAGPFELADLRVTAVRRASSLRSQTRRMTEVAPRSPVVANFSRTFADYDRMVDATFDEMLAGQLQKALQRSASGAALRTAFLDAALALGAGPEPRPRRGARVTVPGWLAAGAAFVLAAGLIRRRQRANGAADGSAMLVENAESPMFVVDRDETVAWANTAAQRLFGRASAAAVGSPLAALLTPTELQRILTANAAVRREGKAQHTHVSVNGPFQPRHFDGSATLTSAEPSSDARKTHSVLWVMHDVTDRQQFERDLVHKAFHDSLTGLPNRALFRDRAALALARNRRNGLIVSVMFIDLDGFKNVNDSLGHEAGDELIVEMGFRLSSLLRPGDTLSRLGGDEFAVLVEDSRPKLADVLAERMLDAIRQPILIRGREVLVGASIGLTEASPSATVEVMLRNADTAMYAAKEKGKNRVERFHHLMFQEATDRLELDSELRRAVEAGQLRLNYQPIVDLRTRRMVGVEALLRWFHPGRGVVPPHVFIPLAEQSRSIIEIGRWVLCEAIGEAARLPRELGLRVNVNVSALQLGDEALLSIIREQLERTGLPPELLVLEITETLLLDDMDAVVRRLDEIRAIGVRIALDDFGTGYSSLSYLQRLPADSLKIDQSFIADHLLDDETSGSFVRAIIELSRNLGLQAVAEGVETEAQAEWLLAAGCTLGQGYLFARPMPPESLRLAVQEYVQNERADRGRVDGSAVQSGAQSGAQSGVESGEGTLEMMRTTDPDEATESSGFSRS